MTVRIDRAVTEVRAAPDDSRSDSPPTDPRWREHDALRRALREREERALRIRAEGFDD